MKIHVADIELRSGNEPVPLEVVSKLRASIEPRLAVTPLFVSEIPGIEIGCLAMAELAAGVQTDVKSVPIAKRRHRRGHDRLFAAVSAGSRKRDGGQRAGDR